MSESEAHLSKDSHNSSMLPPFDGLKKTRSPRSLSGAKSGGQIRHKGTTLKRVREPDKVIEHGLPERSDGCGEILPLPCAQIAERRQTFDYQWYITKRLNIAPCDRNADAASCTRASARLGRSA
ncbi:hypothetical protein [Nitrosomonas mobilis]|uniref:hypothetical protein n=1 Tax=Nitrosomonas mobilis TaxID=51642 RepID=UPI0015A1ACD0